MTSLLGSQGFEALQHSTTKGAGRGGGEGGGGVVCRGRGVRERLRHTVAAIKENIKR